jgi:hypothetical protein
MVTTVDAERAQALFVSSIQSSQRPTAAEIRAAISAALRELGSQECAARVAQEFGDHAETAVGRMAWALATVRATSEG